MLDQQVSIISSTVYCATLWDRVVAQRSETDGVDDAAGS